MTTEKERAYTETERTHNDHITLDAEHHSAPKDGNDDPVFEESDGDSGIYSRTVDEQLKDCTVSCETHGELEPSDLGVGYDGGLYCTFCSLNQEMDIRNEQDIDNTVTVEFDPVGITEGDL